MTENPHMHFPQRAEKAFEWNLNTIISIATLLGVLVATSAGLIGGGIAYQKLLGQIEKHDKWILDHDSGAKERRGEVEADLSRLGAQTQALDERLDTEEAIAGRLSDRVSAAEARNAEFGQTVRELQASINQQSGDLKVILAWIEEQRRQTERKP